MAAETSWEKQYREKDELREKATGAKDQAVIDQREKVARLREKKKDNQRAIRFGAAREAAAGQRSGARGGGAIAAAADVGMAAEARGIAQEKEDQRALDEAIRATTGLEVEAAEYRAVQGTEESDYAEAMAQAETDAEKAIAGSQGFFNDNEEQAARELRSIIARIRVKSPRAARDLEKKYAHRLEDTWSNYWKGWWD